MAGVAALRRTCALALVALAACFGLAGCGGDEESQQEAVGKLCTSLDDFAASVVGLQGLSLGSSSRDDVEQAADDIQDAWDQVVEDAKDVKTASTADLEAAYDDLKQAVQDRPADEPMTDVIAGLTPKVTAFAQAWKDMADGLSCKTTS
jgi:hypothetical protein